MNPKHTLLTLLLIAFVVGLSTMAAPPQVAAAASTPTPAGNLPPFKLGFYGALTGTFAASGKDTLNGLTLFLKEIAYAAGGRKIEVLVEDTAGDPNTALAKARKLVEQDKVDVLVGPSQANEAYAVRNYIHQANGPSLFPTASSDDITQRIRTPWIIRTGWTSSQPAHAFGKWVYDQGKRRVAIIAYDYAFGWENVGGFQRTFEDAGGKIVQKIWTPQTTADFAPYFPQIKKDVDAVVVVQSGGNGVRFLQQWQEFGLKGSVPLYGLAAITDEALLKSMGDEAVGLFTVLHWSAALQTPEAQAFVKKFKDEYKDAPGYRAEAGYVTGQVIAKALENTGGKPAGAHGLVDTLRAVKISGAPRGPISFDPYGGVVENEYIRRVDRVKGELQNTVIATIPNVSQFWTYDPSVFLTKPVYSRDYPSCPNCQ
jgi:branched-chain amino acid transport system substrate-binding protein